MAGLGQGLVTGSDDGTLTMYEKSDDKDQYKKVGRGDGECVGYSFGRCRTECVGEGLVGLVAV